MDPVAPLETGDVDSRYTCTHVFLGTQKFMYSANSEFTGVETTGPRSITVSNFVGRTYGRSTIPTRFDTRDVVGIEP